MFEAGDVLQFHTANWNYTPNSWVGQLYYVTELFEYQGSPAMRFSDGNWDNNSDNAYIKVG